MNPAAAGTLSPAIGADSSILVLGAHPDDVVRGCGGVIIKALAAGAKVTVVKLTDGAALYGVEGIRDGRKTAMARRAEELRAIEILGLPRSSLLLLGFPDGGLEALRNSYHNASLGKPYYDQWLASDRVAEEGTYRQGVPFYGDSLVTVLEEIIERAAPTHVFTHVCQDRHPDHRATSYFTKRAIANLLLANHLARVPAIFEYLTYHTRLKWPANTGPLIDPAPAEAMQLPGRLVDLRLSEAEAAHKDRAQECFVPILGEYMAKWIGRGNELHCKVDIFEGAAR